MPETVVLLLLAGVAMLFRWLTKVGGTREDETDSPQSARHANSRRDESEQERIRRFLEALGMPQGSAPPPPVRPHPTSPRRIITPKPAEAPKTRRRSLLQPLPPLVTVPRTEASPQRIPPEPPLLPPLTPAMSSPAAVVVEGTSPTLVRQPATSTRPSTQRVAVQTSSLAVLLRDQRGLKQAMLLREILGPPRAFVSLDADRAFPTPI